MDRAEPSFEGTLRVSGPGTEYRLVPPHLSPVAMDPVAMFAAAQATLATHPRADDSPAAARGRSVAAFMLLCSGRAAEAETILVGAIRELEMTRQEPARTSAELRLVQVLQGLGRASEAVELARSVLRRQPPEAPARHFVLHHLGKALLQAGAPAEAQAALSEALATRHALGAQELISSTRMALSLLPAHDEEGLWAPSDDV